MKKITFILLLLFSFTLSFSQKVDDNKIIVTVTDTVRLYERTRQAILFTNFMVREDSNRDTMVTGVERMGTSTVYMMARVVIKGNTVEIKGAYGLGYIDFWGFPLWPKGFQSIIYYKESETWRMLRNIAIKLDGKLTFSKDK